MKLNKIFIGAVALVIGTAVYAQQVSLHGYMDYTNFGVSQIIEQKGDNAVEYSNPAAEFGSFYNGSTVVNLFVDAPHFEFRTGIRLNASLEPWYDNWRDSSYWRDYKTDYPVSYFFQGNIRVGLINDQLIVHAGKYDEFYAGFVVNGYAMGAPNIRPFAERGNGQHLTAVELIPSVIPGLRFFAGLPILPGADNDIDYRNANLWKNLYKKFKLAASYKLAGPNITLYGGWRPGTYYDGLNDKKGVDDFTKNYFGEAYLQADMPSLIPGVKLNATYDFRYRDKDAVKNVVEKFVTAHHVGVSGQITSIPQMVINVEDRFFYADDHYIAANEKLVYNVLAIGGTRAISGTPYLIGLNANFIYAQDAKGSTLNNDARVKGDYHDDIALTTDWMKAAPLPKGGAPGRYFEVYLYPYFQKNFGNGLFSLGIELQYTHFEARNTTWGFNYRVPVGLRFWF
ncbi:MAG: hypothetical protein J1D88_03775 [Treponema sp.]|nr:hypothetical protein [Treponema sp.]